MNYPIFIRPRFTVKIFFVIKTDAADGSNIFSSNEGDFSMLSLRDPFVIHLLNHTQEHVEAVEDVFSYYPVGISVRNHMRRWQKEERRRLRIYRVDVTHCTLDYIPATVCSESSYRF
jgi:hypothetical protein